MWRRARGPQGSRRAMGANRREPSAHPPKARPSLRGPRVRATHPLLLGAQRRTLRRQRGPAVAAREPGPRGARHRPRHSLGAGSGRLCRRKRGHWAGTTSPGASALGRRERRRARARLLPHRPRLLRPGSSAAGCARQPDRRRERPGYGAPWGCVLGGGRRGHGAGNGRCGSYRAGVPAPPLLRRRGPGGPTSTGAVSRCYRPRPGATLSRACPPLRTPGPGALRLLGPSSRCLPLRAPPLPRGVLARPPPGACPRPGVRSPRRGPDARAPASPAPVRTPGAGGLPPPAHLRQRPWGRAHFRGPATPACPASAPLARQRALGAAAAGPGTHRPPVRRAPAGLRSAHWRDAGGRAAAARSRERVLGSALPARPAPGRTPRAVAARLTLSGL